jgi:GTP-binding protein
MALSPSGPTVVLVGRPNVGKSTLFNKITGTRRSIVAPVAGTTRDVIAAPAVWRDRTFTLVDTGGLFGATTDPLHALVVEHGLKALEAADVLVFVLDAREGLVPGDEDIAKRLHAGGKPVVMAINKTDDRRAKSRSLEFYRMGLSPPSSCRPNTATGSTSCSTMCTRGSQVGRRTRPTDETRTIIGRPNVGKSSS